MRHQSVCVTSQCALPLGPLTSRCGNQQVLGPVGAEDHYLFQMTCTPESDDEFGIAFCIYVIIIGVVLFVFVLFGFDVEKVLLLIITINVFGLILFWVIYGYYTCCREDDLPHIVITIKRPAPKVKSSTVKRPGVVCTICMEEIEKGTVCKQIPTCKHEFHKTCISKWLVESSTCPNCRLSV